jgi:hypothetical protein
MPRRLDVLGEMIDLQRARTHGSPRTLPDLVDAVSDMTPLVVDMDSRRYDSSLDLLRSASLSLGAAALQACDMVEGRAGRQRPIERLGRLVQTEPVSRDLWSGSHNPFGRWHALVMRELHRAECAVDAGRWNRLADAGTATSLRRVAALCAELVLVLDARAAYAA